MKKILFLLLALSFTISAQITQQWVAAYNGPSGSIDSVRNLVIDNAGNVYVTGSSTSSNLWDYTTLKFNSKGVMQWEARFDGPGHFRDDAKWITIDINDNLYVTGASRTRVQAGSEDIVTLKYNSDGIQQWSARYAGASDGPDVPVKAAADNSGNVYVTGYSFENTSSIDFITIKYNSAGIQQWAARYNGPGNSLDAPSALAVDNSGNVYVTGWSRSTSLYGSEDYVTIKYNSSGVEQWVARHNGTGNFTDAAASVAVDNLGNVFVTGHSYATETLSDYVTIKYNSNGVQQWLAAYNNSSVNGSDLAKILVLDNSGNVYVTGSSGTVYPLGYPNYVTIKYSPSGAQQWAAAYNGPGNGPDEPYSLTLDNYGNIWVTGKATMPGFFYDFATLKYSPSGVQLAELRFNGAGNSQDGATGMAVDYAGNVYVAGNSMYFTNYASDYVIIKYSMPGRAAVQNDNLNGLKAISSGIPDTYILEQNYPNPFNPATKIKFDLPKQSNAKLVVYDILGKVVATLINENLKAGKYEITFNASNLSSGVYFYKIAASGFVDTKKMLLVK